MTRPRILHLAAMVTAVFALWAVFTLRAPWLGLVLASAATGEDYKVIVKDRKSVV